MKRLLANLVWTGCAVAAAPAFAQDVPPPVPFETLSVKEEIDPGPNFFTVQQSWSGRSSLLVYSADDFTFKGSAPAGLTAQAAITADGNTAYVVSTYLRRTVWGEAESVLHVYDVHTLTMEQEIILPPRFAMVSEYEPLVQLSADEHFLFAQNATPASSVTVVDLVAGTVAQELPTPGCWGIYPALSGLAFMSLCGDGTAMEFTLSEDGTTVTAQTSSPIFDVDEDPLFVHGVRAGEDWLFISYNGNVYRVADASGTPTLVGTFSITEDVPNPYAPGGYAVIAYNEPNDLLFVTMHADPYDGSHKDEGDEIWTVDVSEERLLARTVIPDGAFYTLWVDQEEMPTLYASGDDMYRFSVHPDAVAPFSDMLVVETTGSTNGGQIIWARP